jgi:putative Holliday junction resolvase
MSRILAIDYGKKRTGIAISDTLQIIAGGLTTIETPQLLPFLKEYFLKENIEKIVIGYPKYLDNQPANIAADIEIFSKILKKNFPEISIEFFDERFTSKLAFQTMLESGISKKKRKNKALIDKISATIILENYLEAQNYRQTI